MTGTGRRPRVFLSTEVDPRTNLALEESLFRGFRPGDGTIALIYRNEPAVLFGRNQNPWLECDLAYALRENIVPARRASGGGTVYHDMGNVNYSFIIPRADYCPSRFVAYAVETIRSFGLPARQCDRHAIWLDDRKVSGSAFMLTGSTALIHGCILACTDLSRLHRVLQVPEAGIRGRFVASVPSPVANLTMYSPGLTGEMIMERLSREFCRDFGVDEVETISASRFSGDSLWQRYMAQYAGWEWNFGRTGEFVQHLSAGFGRVEVTVYHGRIQSVRCLAEGGETGGLSAFWTLIDRELQHIPYDAGAILDRLTACSAREEIGRYPAARDQLETFIETVRENIPGGTL